MRRRRPRLWSVRVTAHPSHQLPPHHRTGRAKPQRCIGGVSEVYRRCIGSVSEMYRTNTLSTPGQPHTFPLCSHPVHASPSCRSLFSTARFARFISSVRPPLLQPRPTLLPPVWPRGLRLLAPIHPSIHQSSARLTPVHSRAMSRFLVESRPCLECIGPQRRRYTAVQDTANPGPLAGIECWEAVAIEQLFSAFP